MSTVLSAPADQAEQSADAPSRAVSSWLIGDHRDLLGTAIPGVDVAHEIVAVHYDPAIGATRLLYLASPGGSGADWFRWHQTAGAPS